MNMSASTSPLASPHRFIRALRGEPVDRTPVWVMRQAGRYLPEYRRVRATAPDFMAMCRDNRLTTEVALQPLRRYPELDAAIVFSDILTIVEAAGVGLHFETGKGPIIHRPIIDGAAIARLPAINVADQLGYVGEAVASLKEALAGSHPVIGFTGSPWTLAVYMIEGGSSRDFAKAKTLLYQDPSALDALLNYLADTIVEYLILQIDAGADAVQIFDTWGGILSAAAYRAHSLTSMARIVEGVKAARPNIPIIVFTKGGGLWLEAMADMGAAALGLDWGMDIGAAFARMDALPRRITLQGNLDPAILRAPHARIATETRAILDAVPENASHIFNLGHGITPDIDPDALGVMLTTIAEYPR